MRIYLLLLLALPLTVTMVATTSVAREAATISSEIAVLSESEPVKLVSWNVENFFDRWDDPYSRDQITKPSYVSDPRMEKIAKVLRSFEADIVALQEVENLPLLEEFVEKHLADLNYQVVLVEGNDTRGIDVALLTRLPIDAVTSYRYKIFTDAQGQEQKFRRDLLCVEIGGEFDCDVYVVHLKSQHGDEASDVVRESESAAIMEIVNEKMVANADYRAVVTGDFNEVPDMPTLIQLRDGGLVDPMMGTEKWTYNREPYLTRIDFAMCTPALASTVASAEIINQSPVSGVTLESASDHYPLQVIFK